jgi:hypothetical protein
MLSSWGLEKTAAADLMTLISFLKQFDELSLDEFCRLAAQEKGGNNTTIVRRASSSSEPDEALVSTYLNKLREALSNRVKFISLTSEMRADKKIKVAELNAVASRLANIESQKTKKLALDAIVSWAHRKFDTERRLRETSGLF